MKLQHLLFAAMFFLVWGFPSCQSHSSENTSGQTQEENTEELTGKDLLQSLREQAVAEDDKPGRIEQALKPIREEYAKSEKVLASLKDVKVEMGEDCILHIYNHARGREEVRVDALKLDVEGGFSLIPDLNPGDLPGLRIRTIGGESAVEFYRDGKLTGTQDALEIYMAERSNIERITPALVQLLRVCRDLD
ncbi:MAG TPA: hypothetical protein ENJ88_06230 [Phaeodactylibacter sp.]|nr:hypothetical protein [Phaeodactylibacter sp.]